MQKTLTDSFRNLDLGTLLELGLILAAAVALVFLVQKSLPWLANGVRGRRRYVLLAMVPLLRLVIIISAFVLMVPRVIEPSVQNMVAVFGSLGLALGFALKDYASSLVAGIVAVGEAPYRNGDWVEIDGVYGEVTHVGVRALQLVTPDDNLVTIPHQKLWTGPVSNANNGGPQMQCVVDFHLRPGHDGALAASALYDAALTSPLLAIERAVAVVAEEQPWGTRYRLRAYPIDARQQFRFMTDLTLRGKAQLMRLGLDFAASSTAPDPEPPAS